MGALGVEAWRLWIRDPGAPAIFGMRAYERGRVASYAYFAVATGALLLLFPQPIAVPCLVGAALLDPVIGEFRSRGRTRLGVILATTLGLALFILLDWSILASSVATLAILTGELVTIPYLDDDFLMPILPALALTVLLAAGVGDLPADLIIPLGGSA